MTATTQQPVAGFSIGSLRRALASSTALQIAGVTGAYVVGAVLGLRLAFDNPNVTTVWPPTGIAVAAIVLIGPRMWPGIAAGAVLSNVFNGAPIETALAISVGNTLAPLTAGMLLRRSGFHPSLDRLKDVAQLLFIGALGGMLVSSGLGTLSLALKGLIEDGRAGATWFEWWVGDSIGVLLFAPLLLTFGARPATNLIARRPIEAGLLFGSTALVSLLVFETVLPLKYLVFPLAIWAALRFHQQGAALLTVLVSAIAIWQRARGNGSFADISLTASLLSVQGFNAAVALTSLSLAAGTTERLRAEAALRDSAAELEERVVQRTAELQESERRMQEAQALANIGSFHWNMAANRVTWTPELYRIFGVDPEEFSATFEGYLACIHPEDRPRVQATIERSFATAGTYEHEYRIVRPDGEILWVHGRGEAVVDEATGAMIGLTGFCHDITERRNIEDALRSAFEGEREAAKRLRAVDEMKNSLLAAVSHELRTPLTVIIGVADTLARPEVQLESEDTRYLLGRLGVHAQRLHRLLMDLLDLDRLNRGILEARPRPTDIRELVLRVLEGLEMQAHTVSLELDGRVLMVDTAHVERIVENLLVNAAKHTPPGSQIWVRAESVNPGIVLIVEDDGPGVPPELRSEVFEPFRQGDTPSHAPGTGIGLSLVARFAHLNGGRAWLEPRPGGGASFRVLLPTAPISEAMPDASAGAA